MTVQELHELRELKKLSKQKERKIEELESQAEKITATLSHEPKSTSNVNSKEQLVCDLMLTRDSYYSELQEIFLMEKEAKEQIEKIKSVKQKTIISYRYINGYTLENTAVTLGISYQSVCRLLYRAHKTFNHIHNIQNQKG